jgi:hypothetical protein
MAWWWGLSCRVGERCTSPSPRNQRPWLLHENNQGLRLGRQWGNGGHWGLPPYLPIQIFQDAESSNLSLTLSAGLSLVRNTRVVESSDPVNYRWDNGRVVRQD